MKTIRLWIVGISLLLCCECVKPELVEVVTSETGIYFDEIGQISFYPMTWKAVSYINMNPTRNLWRKVKEHQKRVSQYCQGLENARWYYLTDCNSFKAYVSPKINYIDSLRDLVAEYLKTDVSKRRKRGVLDFVGEISKILFGTLTQADARQYNSHIDQLEREQQEFLHISSEQMTVIRSTINSVNLTMRRVNQNEKVLRDSLIKLGARIDNATFELQQEMEQVTTANMQIKMIERGLMECQHGYEMLVDALVHAEQGTFQPQFITAEKIKTVVTAQKLPTGVDYPSFPFSELQHIIVPHVYSHNQFLVYVLDIPLLSSTPFYLYKILPFPTFKQDNVFSFIYPSKDYIFMDSLKRQYGKLSNNELTKCFQPNLMQKVCKEDIPILTYIPGNDCESTLLHPSSQDIPLTCEIRVLKLTKTYWIPLSFSNQWLFVTPRPEKLSVICDDTTEQVEIKQKGKLTLQQQCKAYTTYVTLYAISTNIVNVSHDFVPTIPLDFDCCLTFEKTKGFEEIPLSVPLSNILTSADDLRLASHKVDEVEQMIKVQKMKDYSHWYAHVTSWSAIVSFIVFVVFSCCCCCCCCKSCRSCWFKIWDKWTPKTCWKETSERLCISITNVQGKQPTVRYSRTAHPSPVPSRSQSSSPCTIREPNALTPIIKDDNEEIQLHPPAASLRRSLRLNDKSFR
jgi:hypothetical protein